MNLLFLILFSIQNIHGQSDSLKKYNAYIGLNILRLAVGDIEMQAIHKLSRKSTIGINAGYDFNFLDLNKKYHVDSTEKMHSIEETSHPLTRYFEGSGPVFRIFLDQDFKPIGKHSGFVSIEFLFKIRNYTNRHYGEDYFVHPESAKQQILGLTLYSGKNYYSKNSQALLRFYWGIGLRVLKSKITWPGYSYKISNYPEKNFTNDLVLPSFDIGLTMFFIHSKKYFFAKDWKSEITPPSEMTQNDSTKNLSFEHNPPYEKKISVNATYLQLSSYSSLSVFYDHLWKINDYLNLSTGIGLGGAISDYGRNVIPLSAGFVIGRKQHCAEIGQQSWISFDKSSPSLLGFIAYRFRPYRGQIFFRGGLLIIEAGPYYSQNKIYPFASVGIGF